MGRMKDLHIETCEDIEKAMKLIDEVKSDLMWDPKLNSDKALTLLLCRKLTLSKAYLQYALKLSDWES